MIEMSPPLLCWSYHWCIYLYWFFKSLIFSNSICCLVFPNNFYSCFVSEAWRGRGRWPVNFCADCHCSSLYLFIILLYTVFCIHWGALYKHKSLCINLFSLRVFCVLQWRWTLFYFTIFKGVFSGILWDGVFSAVQWNGGIRTHRWWKYQKLPKTSCDCKLQSSVGYLNLSFVSICFLLDEGFCIALTMIIFLICFC